MVVDASERISFWTVPASPDRALVALTEPIASWFRQRFDQPTLAQRFAWPLLAEGRNLLLAAPTGSGKTLAALLPVLAQLYDEGPGASVRCLYLAPLKALCNDTCRSMAAWLAELNERLPAAQQLRVGLRSGDTSATARKKLFLEPPQLLITTPESLALLLTHPRATVLFAGLGWVVVDEVHALAPGKRGADLSLSLERLEALATGRLQRIGLSATCTPLVTAARFLAGMDRDCTIAQVPESTSLEIRLEPLDLLASGRLAPQRFFCRLLDRLDAERETSQTLLIFCNTRRLAERVGYVLRRRHPALADVIAVHHSSLAPQRRRQVERELKQGQLRIVVSSSSLELGIDIGAVDRVVLVHPPGGVVRLLQRIGRSGHRPGHIRRGLILTGGPAGLLEATVTAAASLAGQLEMLHIPDHPLDVLCQQLLGLAAQGAWAPDEVFALVRRAFPYRNLSRADFDACLQYLSGRRRDGHDWLPSRLRWTGDRFTLTGPRELRVLRRNLGTILSDEPLSVRLSDGTCVGEIDPGFADRLQPGDRFVLDGRCLEFRSLEHRALLVEEVIGRPLLPQWLGDCRPLSRELARRLYLFRVRAAEALRQGPEVLSALLHGEYHLPQEACDLLADLLGQQETISEVPMPGVCLVEGLRTLHGADYYVHTPLNRAGNDALARVVESRLRRQGGRAALLVVADLGFVIATESVRDQGPEDWRRLLSKDGFAEHLEAVLRDSPLLRERFRRVALTGLMLLRNPLGRKLQVGGSDWAERRLFEQVSAGDRDFVLLRQARREVLEECLDIDSALGFLDNVQRSFLHLRWLPCISPLAEAWTQMDFPPEEPPEDVTEILERLQAAFGRQE
jgi:ATP-dependent Lhr-like helicase